MTEYRKVKSILMAFLFIMSSDLLHAADDGILSVFVSIQPQAYFVERIAGDRVSTEVLVPPGKSPSAYALSPLQMSRLSNAKILFRIGVPFENHLIPKIRHNMGVAIVDTRHGIHLRNMEGRHHDDGHSHDGAHMVGGKDPHIWLNPSMVKKQAETICLALIGADPSGKEVYNTNLKIFIEDLERLDAKIRAALLPVKGQAFFVFHPSYGYFADAYNLEQVAVEMEGKTPRGKDLTDLIKKARKRKVRVIFVQPQFDQTAALKIARAIDGAVLPLDPLAYDYINNLESMADNIFHALNE
jgi:zinc transport system substrate-binding protein